MKAVDAALNLRPATIDALVAAGPFGPARRIYRLTDGID
jgi:hypothetical protein